MFTLVQSACSYAYSFLVEEELEPDLLEAKEMLSKPNPVYEDVKKKIVPLTHEKVQKLARFIAKEAGSEPATEFSMQGIAFLVNQISLSYGWLMHLLPPNQSDLQTKGIFAVLKGSAPKVEDVYRRLLQLPYNGCALTAAQRLSIAFFAATQIVDKKGYYKKTEYGLPRSLQWNKGTNSFYILSKSSVPLQANSSTFKRVTRAIEIPLASNQQYRHVAQLVNFDKKSSKSLLNEIGMQLSFSKDNNKGIWPVSHYVMYYKSTVEKVSIIQPLADGTLSRLLEDRTIRLTDKIAAISQICEGLVRIHEDGYIHGDLKETNVLYIRSPLTVGLSDFGFVHRIGSEDLPGLLSDGIYGSITPTAPELLIKKPEECDLKMAEIWALGCMLYQCLCCKSLPWAKPLMELEQIAPSPERDALKKTILTKMKQYVEQQRRETLKEKPALRPSLMLFIYDCLSYEPEKRPSARQACIRIHAL